MSKKNFRVAIVIPWFGKELKGGAEQQAWQLSQKLKDFCELEVLTTCSESFLGNWQKNYYNESTYVESGLTIRRFKVRTDPSPNFPRIVSLLLSKERSELVPGLNPIKYVDEQIYWNENINSPNMMRYLSQKKEAYDFFIFMPYLFPLTKKGVEIVRERALIQGCFHDECYAYLDGVFKMVHQCGGLLFNSTGELEIAKKIYGEWIQDKSFVTYEGIDFKPLEKKQKSISILEDKKFILCLGRKSREKNTHFLVESFIKYNDKSNSEFILVLAGPGNIDLPTHEKIVDLGLISEEEKSYLLSKMLCLVNPSENESFSRVIFESWYFTKPIVINKHCNATVGALVESKHSGWAFEDDKTLWKCFDEIKSKNIQELSVIGMQGKEYCLKTVDWNEVMNRYINIFNTFNLKTKILKKKILLILPDFSEIEVIKDFIEISEQFQSTGNDLYYYSANQSELRRYLGYKTKAILDKKSIYKKDFDFCLWFGDTYSHQLNDMLLQLKCEKILRMYYSQFQNSEFYTLFDRVESIYDYNDDVLNLVRDSFNSYRKITPFITENTYPGDITFVDFKEYLDSNFINILLISNEPEECKLIDFCHSLGRTFENKFGEKLFINLISKIGEDSKSVISFDCEHYKIQSKSLYEIKKIDDLVLQQDCVVVDGDILPIKKILQKATLYQIPSIFVNSRFWEYSWSAPSIFRKSNENIFLNLSKAILFAVNDFDIKQTLIKNSLNSLSTQRREGSSSRLY